MNDDDMGWVFNSFNFFLCELLINDYLCHCSDFMEIKILKICFREITT